MLLWCCCYAISGFFGLYQHVFLLIDISTSTLMKLIIRERINVRTRSHIYGKVLLFNCVDLAVMILKFLRFSIIIQEPKLNCNDMIPRVGFITGFCLEEKWKQLTLFNGKH